MAEDHAQEHVAGSRRVLVVSYFFPPLGGVGVQRTLKYVKYLRGARWRPVVVTPRATDYEPKDPSLLTEIPQDVEVHRSFCWEPSRLYSWLVRVLRYRPTTGLTLGPVAPGGAESPAETTSPQASPIDAPTQGIGKWASLSRILFFPDQQIGWIPFAVRSALRIHRAAPVDALYSSSPPITAHLIAGIVKAWTGLPWVADVRDPWMGSPFVQPLPGPQRWLQRRLERWIVRRADRVVFATPSLKRLYATRYPAAAQRFLAIPNGYDHSETQASLRTDPGDRFRLVYSGSLYGPRGLAPFLDGVSRFLEREPSARDRLDIEFVGFFNAENKAIAEWYASHHRLGSVIRLSGFVPHNEALARVAAADAGLLLIAPGPGMDLVVTGKLFDYIGMDKPLLAVIPQGDARDILRELDWGVVADPEPESVAVGLERLLASPLPTRPADPEGRYDRVRLAARLAEVLDQVAAAEA